MRTRFSEHYELIWLFPLQYKPSSFLQMRRLGSSWLQVTDLISNKNITEKLTGRVSISRIKFEWLWGNVIWFYETCLSSLLAAHYAQWRPTKCVPAGSFSYIGQSYFQNITIFCGEQYHSIILFCGERRLLHKHM